jgi:hypothetical protein
LCTSDEVEFIGNVEEQQAALKRQRVSKDMAVQSQFDQQKLIQTIGKVLEPMLEEKLKDRTKMETEIMERMKTSMLEALQEQTERIYKNFYNSR